MRVGGCGYKGDCAAGNSGREIRRPYELWCLNDGEPYPNKEGERAGYSGNGCSGGGRFGGERMSYEYSGGSGET